MATKDHKRQAREIIEALELRIHAGPPIHDAEIRSVNEFLHHNNFAPASEYFNRIAQIRNRLESRLTAPSSAPAKRNYGGQAGGYWMQLQSAYDHVILSTCYEGEFHLRKGRVKLSHRFNRRGRIDFVELKYLRPLDPVLQGEIRKLMLVKDYPAIRPDWRVAEAFILPILPRELIFLYSDIFRCQKNEVLAWLINIGHRIMAALVDYLRVCPGQTRLAHGDDESTQGSTQLCLEALRTDDVALPILTHAAPLESAVTLLDEKNGQISYSLSHTAESANGHE